MSQSKLYGGIENELKYVLDLRGIDKILEFAEKTIEIRQGYLLKLPGKSARIRESICSGKINYEFTYKHKIYPGMNVELDNNLSHDLFSRLSKQAVGWVRKTRVVIEGWDVDIFKSSLEQPYFLMAEIEMPVNQKFPNKIPSIVREFLIYEVPRNDCRFSSRKLSDVKYATKLLKKIHLKAQTELLSRR